MRKKKEYECYEEPKQKKGELEYLNIRQYLDQTVVPILLQGLSELAKERYSLT